MYPYVAAFDQSGWNSPSCGQCFQLNYKGKYIYFTAIDQCGPPPKGNAHFDISPDAFMQIFGQEGFKKGTIYATFAKANPCKCKGNKLCSKFLN